MQILDQEISELKPPVQQQAIIAKMLADRLPHERDFYGFRLLNDANTTFLDVGGNIGNSALSIHFVRPEWRVISFEPNPSLRQCLDRAAEVITAEGGAFTYFIIGFSDREANLPFYVPQIDDWLVVGEASVSLDHFKEEVVRNRLASYSDHGRWSLIRVQITTVPFDKWVQDNRDLLAGRDVVVKIDVEGAELMVLSGMRGFIAERKPIFLIENSAANSDAIDTLLSEYEYRPYSLNAEATAFYPRGNVIEAGQLNSFYFCPDHSFPMSV